MIDIRVGIELRQNQTEVINSHVTIEGQRIVDGQPVGEHLQLAVYTINVPLFTQGARLIETSNEITVRNAACKSIGFVNTSSFKWGKIRIRSSEPLLSFETEIVDSLFLGKNAQIVNVKINGLSRLSGTTNQSPAQPLHLSLFASDSESKSFLEIGSFDLTLRFLSSIECFPSELLFGEGETVSINLVSRGLSLAEQLKDISISLDGHLLRNETDYTVKQLSPMWTRIEFFCSPLRGYLRDPRAIITVESTNLGLKREFVVFPGKSK